MMLMKRRDFLKAGAAAGAMASLYGCAGGGKRSPGNCAAGQCRGQPGCQSGHTPCCQPQREPGCRADCQPGTGARRISRFAGRAHGGLQHLPRLRGFVQRRCALLQQMRLPL